MTTAMLPDDLADVAAYKPGDDGRRHPWAIQVIEVAGGRIVGHHNFIGPDLFARFGLPDHLSGDD